MTMVPPKQECKRHVLVFRAGALDALRIQLLADAPLETAQFLFARPVQTPSGAWRLLVHDTVEVEREDYTERTSVSIELPPSLVARVLQRGRASGSTVVLAHSHPLGGLVGPSQWDREGEARLLPALRRRIPGVPHARLIVSPDALHAALFDINGDEAALEVHEIGANLKHLRGEQFNLRDSDSTYDRQVRAFGEAGQRHLGALRVGVVGLGGTGSVVVQQLAHLGVGTFLLIDPDALEPTNLNRVVGTRPDDVGKLKVEVARAMIQAINPAARVDARQADVRDATTARSLLDVDVIFGCTDSHGSRAVLAQLAYQYLVPAIDVGVAIHAGADGVSHISGRVQMLAPGLPCLLCGGVLDPEAVRRDLLTEEARRADPYIVGAATPQPAVISINSTASSLAVTMLLSAVTGIPVIARHQRIRFESGVVARIESAPAPGCPLCSPRGALGRGDTWPMPGRQA